MDLLLVLISATALLAMGLVADCIATDLRGGDHAAGGPDRAAGGDRPMRLDLLALSPEEYARLQPVSPDDAARAAARAAADAWDPATAM